MSAQDSHADAPSAAPTTTSAPTRGSERGRRPFRGRGGSSMRGRGRGGGHSGHQRSTSDDNAGTESANAASAVIDDDSQELRSLRAKYSEQLPQVKAVFSDWTDEDILNVLAESSGAVEVAVSRIADGQAEQWGAVKAKKRADKPPTATSGPASRSQTSAFATNDNNAPAFAMSSRGRGAPGRGAPRGSSRGDARGGRGSRGQGRGASRGQVNGHAPPATDGGDLSSEQTELPTSTAADGSGWGDEPAKQAEETIQSAQNPASTVAPAQAKPAAQPAEQKPISAAAKGKGPAVRPAQPAGKLSWAQIARPPAPVVKPTPEPLAPAAVTGKPEEPAASEPKPEEPTQQQQVDLAAADETAPLLAPKQVEPAASQDPWASTPAASSLEPEPAPLGVGEGWAESIIAAPSATDSRQHERALEAAPAAGVDPAGPLDVHTPVPAALPEQQHAFDQPSALEPTRSSAPNEKLNLPPGLSKRASSRMQSDAAVIMPSSSTPDLGGVGVQFGSLNFFGGSSEQEPASTRSDAVPSQAAVQSQQSPQQQRLPQPIGQMSAYEAPAPQPEQEKSLESVQSQSYQQQANPAYSQQNQYAAYQQQLSQQPQQQAQQAVSTQAGYGQDRASALQGLPYASQASAYASRYPQSQNQYQQQHQQGLDAFAGLSSQSYGNQNALSQYFAQQSQPQQASHHSSGSGASPAPPLNIRGEPIQTAAAGSASTYGGFTSALGQGLHQSPYGSNDYGSQYAASQDPMRSFYAQYEQQQQQQGQQGARQEGTDDALAKLGVSGSPYSAIGQQQTGAQSQQQGQQAGQMQQQQQGQQQGYAPNMMPPYGHPYYHYGMPPNYGQQPGVGAYGGYGAHYSPYGGYPGYGVPAQQANGSRQYGQQQQAQQHSQAAGGHAQNYRGYNGAQAGNGLSAYGNGGYTGYDAPRTSSGQGQQTNGQSDRSGYSKDIFNDRFFSPPN